MKKLGLLLGMIVVGCSGASGDTLATSGSQCQQGYSRTCMCDAGGTGTQACATDGTWNACKCSGGPLIDASADVGESDAPSVCGNQHCEKGEDCMTCPGDCGQCPTCDLAPTCSGAFSVPTTTTHLTDFDNNGQTSYVSGVGMGVPPSQTTCSDPRLKIRLKEIDIGKNGVSGKLSMFCIIQADDGISSELVVTPLQSNLQDNAPPIPISPSSGTFWGQDVGSVKTSEFNMTITYQCYQVTDNSAVTNALNAVAGMAGALANPANPYGWAFGIGGAAAAAAAAAVQASNGNTLFLNVQQTIDKGALLKLTNGDNWVVQQSGNTGGVFCCDWDWKLVIEAWGCSTPRIGGTGK